MQHATHSSSRPSLRPPPGPVITAVHADICRTANTVLHARPDTRHARPTGRGAAHPRSSRTLTGHGVSKTRRAPTDIPLSHPPCGTPQGVGLPSM
jgi:hypothetical protein